MNSAPAAMSKRKTKGRSSRKRQQPKRPSRRRFTSVIAVAAWAAVLIAAIAWWAAFHRGRSSPVDATQRVVDRVPLLPGSAKGRNVIIITLDTTRADRIGCYGCNGIKTPHIDALANPGVLFRDVTSPVANTLPAHCTIMTGLDPHHHGVLINGAYRLDPKYHTLAQTLKEAGYPTAAFVCAFVLDHQYGIARGFDRYDDDMAVDAPSRLTEIPERPAHLVVPRVLDWIGQNANRRFFLWLHLFEPHLPYVPPPPYREQYPNDPYCGEIAYADAKIGEVIAHVRALGLYDRSLIVFASDHGEALGEHGEATHSHFVYRATNHVPLILTGGGLFQRDHVIELPVSLADVFPTVLDLLGLPVPTGLDGASWLAPPDKRPQELYLESRVGQLLHGWAPLFAIRQGKYEFIEAPRPELYDLRADPHERHNLAAEERQVAGQLRQRLMMMRQSDVSAGRPAPQTTSLDAETEQKLRALGYLEARFSVEQTSGPDPKDKIHLFVACGQAHQEAADGHFQEARKILESVVAEDPNFRYAWELLADLSGKMNDRGRRLQALERVVELDPNVPDYHRALGVEYLREGDGARAKASFDRVVALAPKSFNALYSIGLAYEHHGDLQAALGYLERALAVKPDHAKGRVSLAYVYAQLGRVAEAAEQYEKAAAADANNVTARENLATIYAASTDRQLHNPQRALAYAEQAARLRPNHYHTLQVLSLALSAAGQHDAAVDIAQRALALAPQEAKPSLQQQLDQLRDQRSRGAR